MPGAQRRRTLVTRPLSSDADIRRAMMLIAAARLMETEGGGRRSLASGCNATA
jgi:hypothetical protein